jgi:hypothetical protein
MEQTKLWDDPRNALPKEFPQFLTTFQQPYGTMNVPTRPPMPGGRYMPVMPLRPVQGGMFLPEGFDQPLDNTPLRPRVWRK